MDLIQIVVTHFAHSITSLIFVIVLVLTFMFISRFVKVEEAWLGLVRTTLNTRFLNAILYGMIVGLIASFSIVLIGIPLEFRAVLYVWPLAILLMLINKRYMCLSYAGGLISLSSLMFGFPRLNVPSIIALIGILHLMESLLIIVDGYRDNLPIWLKQNHDSTVGGYFMNKVWPIPLVVLIVPEGVLQATGGAIAMPDWWPLFQHGGVEMLALFPIVAVMGYSDIAVTTTSKNRARETGLWLALYSVTLMVLAFGASRIHWMSYVAALSAPILHEILILNGKKSQLKGKPAFSAPWRGLRVLEILPNSFGEKMDIKQGDLIMAINGKDVNSMEMFEEILKAYPTFVWIDIKRNEQSLVVECRDYKDGITELGLIFVPKRTTKFFSLDEQNSLFSQLWKKIQAHRSKGGL